MKKPDFDYYRKVVSTQHDPDILQSELKDLINESVAYIEKDDGSKVPCSDRVMPARVTEGTDFHQMQFSDGGMYVQRKDVREATDSPLSLKEIVIIKLCETILGKKA